MQTVTGPVAAEDLGVTLIHEHLFSFDEMVAAQWPHVRQPDREYALALHTAQEASGHGVRTVVDPTAPMIGRDVRAMARVAQDTGLNIVACTGVYTYEHLPRYLLYRSADDLAELFVHDIETGIQGTEIRAAFIKCAADEAGMTRAVEKVHRAAARASLRTGAPIMAHSRPASGTGPLQAELFRSEGVAPEKIQIAHTGDTDDLEYIGRLLEAGVYVGMDRYGLDMFLPTARRNATVLTLLERGHANRMLLSHDYSPAIAHGLDWYTPEAMERSRAAGATTDWRITFLFKSVIPALKDGGMTEAQLETMMVGNPARWLGR